MIDTDDDEDTNVTHVTMSRNGTHNMWMSMATACERVGCTMAELEAAMTAGMPAIQTHVADWQYLIRTDLLRIWLADDQETAEASCQWRAWRTANYAENRRAA